MGFGGIGLGERWIRARPKDLPPPTHRSCSRICPSTATGGCTLRRPSRSATSCGRWPGRAAA